MKNKTILAYSGGLDTSAMIPWLIENYQTEVIAYCCDLGNQPDRERIEENAYKYGASQFIFEDLKEVFVKDYVFKALRAGATYQEDYLLGTAIARPLIAERIAKFAEANQAKYIAHGATGKGNDHIRFEKAWAYLVPDKEILAAWKIWQFQGRNDLVNYLQSKGFEYEALDPPKYSVDTNLFHKSMEGGVLEEIGRPYDLDEILTRKNEDEAKSLTLTFKKGCLEKINGTVYTAAQGLELLNEMGQSQQIGMVDIVEERFSGLKSRGIYQTPGGTILFFAIKQLKQICWSRKLYQVAKLSADLYGDSIYDGDWHTDASKAIEGFFEVACQKLEGEIGLRIHRGQIFLEKRESPFSLYNEKAVSFENDEYGLYEASPGFTKFATYPLLAQGRVK